MNSLLTLAKDLEQKSKAQQQSTGEMLKAAFSEHEQSVRAELSESEKRISAAILDHDRKLSSAMSQRTKDAAHGQPDVADHRLVSALLIASSAGILWWQGQQILDNYTSIREQKDALEKLNARTWGVRYQEDNQGRFLVLPEGVKADKLDVRQWQEEWHQTGTGVEQHDGSGKTVIERIRAATTGLLEKAGRVGERLRGMADDVWTYATGERGAERARHGLEQAGAEFERAAAPVVEQLNTIEQRQQHERIQGPENTGARKSTES
jgi:hypothetical protein